MIGLESSTAFATLQSELNSEISNYQKKIENENIFLKIKSAFAKRYDSPLGFFSIITTILILLGLIVIENYFSAFIIFIILLINLTIVIRECNLRRTEIIRKAAKVLGEIRLAEDLCVDWEEFNYPHLCCPVSPCVSLQWTYRNGNIVNLPWALLVKGDCIVLRPGHTVPGPCTEIHQNRKFKANETYGVSHPSELPTKPIARSPLPNLICRLENTPFLDNLKIILENSVKRPPTIYNQQRYLLVSKYMQQFGFICAIVIAVMSGLLRYYGFSIENDSIIIHKDLLWRQILFDGPISTVIPLLPLFFPVLWISINLWGVARLETFLHQPQNLFKKKIEKSFEEDLDTPTYYDTEHVPLNKIKVFCNWIELWKGSSDLLGRSANVVQVLGSVTALCCIDKKGILSWPNPTAEKIFFLHDSSDEHSVKSQTSLESENTINNTNPTKKTGIIAEVLDLTHDQNCPYKVEFDDHDWKNHINSVKPLGLAILLNTCNQQTHTHYAKFCGHVSAVAMGDKDLIPVTNRYEIIESSLNSFLHGRCLCELAKQIGFSTSATDHFTLEGQLASYRHLQADVVRRDIRFARQLQLSSKVKVPFPHSLSVVLRENPGNMLSLFSQGTADIVLDCCDDFWDGKDLKPLGPQERKRAQDFYQRNALTAYCTAFAYRPLRHGISGALNGFESNLANIAYLELPPESKCKMQHPDKTHCDFEGHLTKLSHSISTDSLLFSESKEEDCADVESCFEMQCHQVFIGMITMQYQAQTDIVQLVERLERACIRFVHFSKENELRSRVFSEKMGLESGWNCHISLLSEESSNQQSPKLIKDDNDSIVDLNLVSIRPMALESTKTLSSSAPGAISNQEFNLNNPGSRSNSNQSLNDFEVIDRPSEDSALDENCRSLSILTDSTEQSDPVNFDMSNRAKLPRGIKAIRPHLEQVDNVPLQVSLFTDCSAEATREMLNIMQSYGEIVVCLGSSASNSNAEIFLQADCSIAVEPLYPQVCQNISAYSESNILNNRFKCNEKFLNDDSFDDKAALNCKTMYLRNNTISPIYLSRILNGLPCSISVLRDDPLSILSIIDLSRRFSLGLWNCIQFWACCSIVLSSINLLVTCLSLPPIFTPICLLYLMCVIVPIIAISLTNIEVDSKIMSRATGKKQTKFNSKVLGFVILCYGCKFLPAIIVVVLSYCTLMAHPIEILDVDENNLELNLHLAQIFSLFGIVFHFIIVSISFVHRDHLFWRKNPFSNRIWTLACCSILILHLLIIIFQITSIEKILSKLDETWPVILFILLTSIISFLITELCKYQEIKVNLRYQRRARLDFGTKLGMNSPF